MADTFGGHWGYERLGRMGRTTMRRLCLGPLWISLVVLMSPMPNRCDFKGSQWVGQVSIGRVILLRLPWGRALTVTWVDHAYRPLTDGDLYGPDD